MTATLVAVEGLDGAGKHTLTTAVGGEFARRGMSVATLAFPRYGTLHADLAADALHGRLGEVADSAHSMALMFALDRFEAKDELARLRASHDVVLLDRYVASNAAYSAARLGPERRAETIEWIGELEFGRFALPRPDLHLLLATPVELAARRADARANDNPGRARDRYERDSQLQAATAEAYAFLAESAWASPWETLGPDTAPAAVCDRIVGR